MHDEDSPTPERIWQLLTGFQMTAALKAAIELDIFTRIAEGNGTAEQIARSGGISERGVRILCDTLTVIGLLRKNGGQYSLADDAAMFLVKSSQAYLGS